MADFQTEPSLGCVNEQVIRVHSDGGDGPLDVYIVVTDEGLEVDIYPWWTAEGPLAQLKVLWEQAVIPPGRTGWEL